MIAQNPSLNTEPQNLPCILAMETPAGLSKDSHVLAERQEDNSSDEHLCMQGLVSHIS